MKHFKVVDLFAGAGGLGEGFASYRPTRSAAPPYDIVMTAEMMPAAVATLKLRTFYRLCIRHTGKAPQSYYDYMKGLRSSPFDGNTECLWRTANDHVQQIVLGTEEGNLLLSEGLKAHVSHDVPWILIGGPPCQAYSLVGRSRNKGKEDYRPEEDRRHFLYREYLKALVEYQPKAFVMENVKGILTSRVGGKRIFPQILLDLSSPSCNGKNGPRYRIHSLATGTTFCPGDDAESFDSSTFILRSEEYGLPQARHRVILLGVREDVTGKPEPLRKQPASLTVKHAIGDLPALRSGLSYGDDGEDDWKNKLHQSMKIMLGSSTRTETVRMLLSELASLENRTFKYGRGGRFVSFHSTEGSSDFARSMQSTALGGVTNHEARGHMSSDLVRYLFATSFAKLHLCSPKASDFPKRLAPDHHNWASGHFADRFRVQVWDRPSTTVVSHIAKDGHYFIHPDPQQCRSLTVREAARLQTFPDDYFFEGNRTEQYTQVGNAVPPMLSKLIANAVYHTIT